MGILLLNSDSGKMRVLIIVAAFVALAAAGEKEAAKSGKGYGHKSRFIGKCGNDGFYYNDANSFVICSNGNAYYQPCAPGSKNKGHSQIKELSSNASSQTVNECTCISAASKNTSWTTISRPQTNSRR